MPYRQQCSSVQLLKTVESSSTVESQHMLMKCLYTIKQDKPKAPAAPCGSFKAGTCTKAAPAAAGHRMQNSTSDRVAVAKQMGDSSQACPGTACKGTGQLAVSAATALAWKTKPVSLDSNGCHVVTSNGSLQLATTLNSCCLQRASACISIMHRCRGSCSSGTGKPCP